MLQATTTFARSPASRDYLAHRRSPLRVGTDLPIGGSPVGALSRKRSTRGAVPVSARPCRRPAHINWSKKSNIPGKNWVRAVYPSTWVAQSPEHQGTGSLPISSGWVNCRKYPDSWVRAVQSPSLGGSAAVSLPKA
ncbi:hypothetical protein GW17_00027606 [Ensete ventricosum]|nr:hypothetical protein GW17_00027606 [Ensete ventricosum]